MKTFAKSAFAAGFATLAFATAAVAADRTPINDFEAKALAKQVETNATAPIVAPADFDKYLMYLSSTPFVSVDGSFLVDGMMAGDGMNFHSNIMGRSTADIEQSKQSAKDFFMQRFGIDVDSTEGVMFTGFEVTPDMNYRAVISSGEFVPQEGFSVHDGGWMLGIMNPAGVDLGGEFAGTHVPPGTMFVSGTYKVVREYRLTWGGFTWTWEKDPIVIDYRSSKPILVEADGSFAVSCELHSEEWGHGNAIGGTLPVMLADGKMAYNTRNVLTFPSFGHTIEAAKVGN